jgi:hypothetical protein
MKEARALITTQGGEPRPKNDLAQRVGPLTFPRGLLDDFGECQF